MSSLRTKLVCMLTAIVLVATCPIIYFSYITALARAQAAAEDRFDRTNRILDEEIQLSYLNAQMLIAEKVRADKTDLIEIMDQIEIEVAAGHNVELLHALEFHTNAWSTHMAVVSEHGEYLYLSSLIWHLVRQGVRDTLGIPVRDFLKADSGIFYRNYFTILRADVGERKNVPYLLGVRKIAGYNVIVMQELAYLERLGAEHQKMLEGRLQDAITSIEMSPETNYCIITAEGRIIASRGPHPQMIPLDASEEDMAAVQSGKRVVSTGMRFGEDVLYTITYFEPLDWYVHASIPMDYLQAPVKAHSMKLLALVFLGAGMIGLLGFLTMSWLLKPLGKVSLTAKRLEEFDFLEEKAEERWKELLLDLPQHQKDEIGQVSRAFAGMLVALEKNINDLKDVLKRQHSIEGELNAAHEIQLGMLPDAGNGFCALNFRAAALMNAAKEVGGDFYDVIELPDDREALILGDVSGKGVSAALFMCVTLTLARNAIMDGLSASEVMTKVNEQLAANNPNCMFVTLWIGILDRKTGRLSYANGGHCSPALLPGDGSKPVSWLRDVSGPLVGVFGGVPFGELTVDLALNDKLFVYSDGVTEAMNATNELFGEERMMTVFEANRGVVPQGVIYAMMTAIAAHRGEAMQSDDITMLAFEWSENSKGDAS